LGHLELAHEQRHDLFGLVELLSVTFRSSVKEVLMVVNKVIVGSENG
jgi:hypothetical protein